ncbi:MAG: 3-deoxy-D-manno-octulosonic acid transferase [Tepidisphaeraceae bacterium]|jgi:3-deoxy-D-manno-octulosonic-acid transferase
MINQYDIAYGVGVGLAAPFWLLNPSARRKVFSAYRQRMGHVAPRDVSNTAVMIHAVSLGEINSTRVLVDSLRAARPGLQFIVSVTTETGFARGRDLYGAAPDVTLVRFPLDFSSAVDRLLDTLRPAVVVLLELEVWPNFIHGCATRHIPVLLINGRVSAGSFGRYRMARPILGGVFRGLDRACVQDETYAIRFRELGVPPDRVIVTGTMKFDTAQIGQRMDGQEELASAVGLSSGAQRIWVCGSTGPGEEAILLPIYKRLLERFADLQLVIVPRKPERFDEVARLIQSGGFGLIRRSNPQPVGPSPSVVLGDTMGELRKFYALADLVFVGRTLVDQGPKQHGSDMIEPAALGKPVIVGPFTANFADAMERFSSARAIEVIADPSGLEVSAARLLAEPQKARAMGAAAQQVVRESQGATQRHVKIILDALQSV